MRTDTASVGVDVGSGSVRAVVFDHAGNRRAEAVYPIRQFNPRSDVFEQSSADIWAQTCNAVRQAVADCDLPCEAITGIGFDATCSLVAVGAGGKPVSVAEDGDPARDIVMWMDHRAVAEAAEINATHDPALAYVGGEVSVEMELPKLLWLRRHFPERYAAAWRFLDLADYMVWRASGADVASVCTLTCKWNYLAHEGRFSDSLLAAIGMTDLPAKIPIDVRQLGSAAGLLSEHGAAELGLLPGIAVATGIIDAHAGGLALLGAAPEGGLAIISGTSCCHLVNSAAPVMVPGVWGPYFGAMLPGWWLNEGGQSAAGSLIDWTLRQSDAWPGLQTAAKATHNSVYALANAWVAALQTREPEPTRHLHVLADHHGNRSPRADPAARGVMAGLSLEHGPDALARHYLATVQALAYGTRHIIRLAQCRRASHPARGDVRRRRTQSAAGARTCRRHRLRPARGKRGRGRRARRRGVGCDRVGRLRGPAWRRRGDGASRCRSARQSGAARVPRCEIRDLSGDVRRLVPVSCRHEPRGARYRR